MLVFWKFLEIVEFYDALRRACAMIPDLEQILVISVWDDTWMGFTHAEQVPYTRAIYWLIEFSNKSYESIETNQYC